MFSSSLRNASRTAARSAHSSTHAARRVAGTRVVGQRFQSTATGGGSGSAASHAAAGVAGGAVVLLGAYGYYHFSGAKKVVDTTKSAHAQFEQLKATIAEKAPKNPSEALNFLRSVAKSTAGTFPGVSSQIDAAFDALDELHDTHGEELNKIIQGAYDDVSGILKEAQQKGTGALDAATASKLTSALGTRVSELHELGKKAGSDAFAKLEEKYPMVAQTLGSSYGELKGLAQRGGPEAKKFVEESIAQVQDLLKNSKSAPDAWKRASELVQGKAQKLKEMVWDRAAEEAKGNPELEKLLNENKETFIQAGASVQSLREVIERVGQTVKGGVDQKRLAELREFVQTKAQESRTKGWESLQEWVKTVPGGDEALKKLSDVDIQSLMKLTQEKSGDAKQLAEETYRDLLKVLQEKAGKAKSIVDEGKEEVKDKSSSSK